MDLIQMKKKKMTKNQRYASANGLGVVNQLLSNLQFCCGTHDLDLEYLFNVSYNYTGTMPRLLNEELMCILS